MVAVFGYFFKYHSSRFLNLNMDTARIIIPMIPSASIWGQRISRPVPFKKIPVIIMKKYLRGFK